MFKIRPYDLAQGLFLAYYSLYEQREKLFKAKSKSLKC